MNLNINEGDRPSLLELGRLASHELSDDEAAALDARLGANERDVLDQIEAARQRVRPFDAASLRQRATALVPAAPDTPEPANRSGRGLWMALFAVAAAVLLGVVLTVQPGAPPPADITFRSGDAMQLYVLDGDHLLPWNDEALTEGDVVGFKVNATGSRSVVLLSVDHTGHIEVYWPEDGRGSEPLLGGGMVALQGTLVLDDHQGSEAFVAVFDTRADTAVAQAERAFADGGLAGIEQWAADTAGVDAVAVPRGEVR